MKVTINDEVKDITAGKSVSELVAEIYPDKKGGIAVAVNDKIVRKLDWEAHIINEGDSIVIINAAYGG